MLHEFFEPYLLSFEPYLLPTDGGRPSWASRFGKDKFGIYADLEVRGTSRRFRLIKPGTFLMRSPKLLFSVMPDETQYDVTISKPFWISDSPVTQEFWAAVMGKNPSHFKSRLRSRQNPVETVSWDECADFCSKLRDLFLGTIFRPPTDEEWEYSCRAGTTGATYAEALGCGLGDIAWYDKNSNKQTQPVKQKLPNPWGLYDMLGNVYERCSSVQEGSRKWFKVCGGSWLDDSARVGHVRLAVTGQRTSFVGFRLVIDF